MFQIKKTHIITPVCPRCGSDVTGRYIQGSLDCNSEINLIYSYYKRGERVRIKNTTGPANCYCESCNMEWQGKIEKIKCSDKEWSKISDEIKLEGRYYCYSLNKRTSEMDEAKKELKKEKAKKIFDYTAFFFFGYRFWKKDKRK